MPMFDIPKEIDEIKIKKDINDFMRKIQVETKPEKCILCGKEQTSFCNSHSVPKMVLKNIAKAGLSFNVSPFNIGKSAQYQIKPQYLVYVSETEN